MTRTTPQPETTMKTFLKALSWFQLVTAVLSGDPTAIAVAVSTDEK